MRALFVALLLLASMPARAALIDVGGGVLRQEGTTLEWLAFGKTSKIRDGTGWSYDQIIAGAGGFSAQGWRYATLNEVCALAALAPCPGSRSEATLADPLGLWRLGGTYIQNLGLDGVISGAQAFFAPEPGSDRLGYFHAWNGAVDSPSGGPRNVATFVEVRSTTPYASTSTVLNNDFTAHMLVRTVPEPSTMMMVTLGLLCLSALRLRIETPRER